MKTITVELPAMFGDHHVTEVRRLIMEIPGVEDVYASSCFQVAEISFDESEASEDAIVAKLDEAGYIGELAVAVEKPGTRGENGDDPPFFRHSTQFVQTKQTVNFTQRVSYEGRPLWPCPGMGPVTKTQEEE